jgi:hypothetical protein
VNEQKADSQGDKGIEQDGDVVKRPDALRLRHAIFLYHDKIQPGAGEFVRPGAVEQVQQQAEQQEDAQKDEHLAPAKERVVCPQHAEQDEDLAKFVPLRL